MRKRKIHKSAFAVSLAGLLCIGGTAAYYSDYAQAKNDTAVGKNETEIQEDFPKPEDPGDNETPEYKKSVWVSNLSSAEKGFNVDCYVRVSLSYSNYDIGKAVTLLGLDTVKWKYNSDDGYYYYTSLLKEGESTTPLFTGFRINKNNVDTLYWDFLKDFEINVYEESVEAGEFREYQSAWNYYLNPLLTT